MRTSQTLKYVTRFVALCMFAAGARPGLAQEPSARAAAAAPAKQGLFVAVGYGGFRGWSADGANWNAERWSDKNQDDPNIIFALCERKGVLLASGGGVGKGFILRSTDGQHWEEVVRTRWRIAGVLALADRFLSIYDDHFQTSTDGVTWKPQAAAKFTAADGIGSGYLRRWAASKDTVVFAGDYALGDKPRIGWIGSSQNGATPLRVETEPADVRGLAFGHGEFVACTKDGVLLRSNDGQKFEHVVTLDDQFDDGCLRFYRERFYVRGRHGMQVSIDGLKWEPLAKSLRIPRAVAPDGVAVDCGWGGLDYAADGEHYQKAKVPIDPTGICDVLYVVPRDQATATTKK